MTAKETPPKLRFIRYTPAIDIVFLKEVVATNPFSDATKWERVVKQVNKAVKGMRPDAKDVKERSIRERLAILLDSYVKEDMAALKRSGTEEEYSEREILLQEVRELKGESEEVKKEKKAEAGKKADDLEGKGEEVRRKAMEGMSKDPTPTKKQKFDVGAYLERKNEFEERRLALEEQKLEAQREERRGFMDALMKLAANNK